MGQLSNDAWALGLVEQFERCSKRLILHDAIKWLADGVPQR